MTESTFQPGRDGDETGGENLSDVEPVDYPAVERQDGDDTAIAEAGDGDA